MSVLPSQIYKGLLERSGVSAWEGLENVLSELAEQEVLTSTDLILGLGLLAIAEAIDGADEGVCFE